MLVNAVLMKTTLYHRKLILDTAKGLKRSMGRCSLVYKQIEEAPINHHLRNIQAQQNHNIRA